MLEKEQKMMRICQIADIYDVSGRSQILKKICKKSVPFYFFSAYCIYLVKLTGHETMLTIKFIRIQQFSVCRTLREQKRAEQKLSYLETIDSRKHYDRAPKSIANLLQRKIQNKGGLHVFCRKCYAVQLNIGSNILHIL